MGCFFGCFRTKDDRSRSSHSTCRKHTEPVISKNRLSSLFRSEDLIEKEKSWKNDIENQRLESPQIDKSLKDEAKILKACGTLPETPSEIRKASLKLRGSPSCAKDVDSSHFHSWLPNTSISKLQLDRQCDQLSTPIKLPKEGERGSASLENTPSSCISNVYNTGSISISSTDGSDPGNASTAVKVLSNQTDSIKSVSPWISGTNAQGRCKSVHFECDFDASTSKGSSSANISQNSGKCESPGKQSLSQPSPNPTPLKLSDDMQTRKDLNVDASLSNWLKPPSSACDDDKDATASRQNPFFGRTPVDRPIIGMVAAHWKEEETSQMAPKWWDGNGIPNSTNKYKEDQKVSWHATPFEERLEKALSEESSISQRKNTKENPTVFDETEETDTALSQLRHSPHSKSVVSY